MESLSDGWISGVSHYYVLMGECDNFYRAAKMMKKFEVQKTLSGLGDANPKFIANCN